MADPSRIRASGPLDVFAAGFASELSRQGYTRKSARDQMRLVAHLSRWIRKEGLHTGALCAAEVERFLRDRRAAGYTNLRTAKAMRPLLGYLRGLGAAPTPAGSLAQVRAISVLTVAVHREPSESGPNVGAVA